MKNLFCAAALTSVIAAGATSPLPYHLDVKTVSAGKMAPHASRLASPGDPYSMSLDGKWQFAYTDDARTLPDDVSAMVMNETINVPGNWERQGFGTAIYVNQEFEFAPYRPKPPKLPDAIPAGVYRRTFTVPESWDGRDIVLKIGAAKSGMYVYVNGHEAGYSEDSKNPAEFLLNPYLKKGENTVTLKIMRWSTGSYLEAQDFWRVSGIERSVSLEALPRVRTADYAVSSTLDDSYRNGLLRVKADIVNTTGKRVKNLPVALTLSDDAGKTLISETRKTDVAANGEATVEFAGEVPDVKKWSAEDPNLYNLEIRCGDDVTRAKAGFRRIELVRGDSILLFNGQPIKFKGVNIHEHNAVTGHYVDEALIKKDFELMKSHNINAVRLCHYPQSDRFYELADSMGLYVYDEANIESHGMYYDLRKGGTLGNNPDWLEAHMDRTRNMFERNKNHASVTVWSLGNEAGNGYNFYETYLWTKDADKDVMKRPVVYERAQWEWNSDMYVPQYPGTKWLRAVQKNGADRPVVMSEYSHAMGNSNGSLAEMWDVINETGQLQGGFIWDWVDQGFLEGDADGREYFTYGGDYGTGMPSSGNFNCNGIVNPDRRPHPAMSEVKYAYQNAGFRLDGNRLTVRNRNYFVPVTDGNTVRLTYYENGKKSGTEQLKATIMPQQEQTLTLNGLPTGNDAIAVAELLDADGKTVASEKFQLTAPGVNTTATAAGQEGPALKIEKSGNRINAVSEKVALTVNTENGVIEKYSVNGRDYLSEGFGIRPNYWRGPTDNDYGNRLPVRSQRWKKESMEPGKASVTAKINNGRVRIDVTRQLEAGPENSMVYELSPNGTLTIETALSACDTINSNASLPRFGLRMRLPKEMARVDYFGNGPDENYSDRNRGSMPGEWTTTAGDMYFPYVRPQENGHRTGVRRLRLSDTQGKGLTVVADSVFEFNALRNSVEDFDGEETRGRDYQWNNRSPRELEHHIEDARNILPRQTHLNDIAERDYVEVCLDGAMQGVGGYDSWGARPEPEYVLDPRLPRKRTFILIPD